MRVLHVHFLGNQDGFVQMPTLDFHVVLGRLRLFDAGPAALVPSRVRRRCGEICMAVRKRSLMCLLKLLISRRLLPALAALKLPYKANSIVALAAKFPVSPSNSNAPEKVGGSIFVCKDYIGN